MGYCRLVKITSMTNTQERRIIVCPQCDAKVSAAVLAKNEFFDVWMDYPVNTYFLECLDCKSPLLGRAEMYLGDYYDEEGKYTEKLIEEAIIRVWPEPERQTSPHIPQLIFDAIDEAERCFKVKAYNACAVMGRRALEAICKDNSASRSNLAAGLRELKDKGVIDGKLYEWSETLRQGGNIGAHISEIGTTRADARDILDFTHAIVEYVFVLNRKYEAFKKRHSEKKNLGQERQELTKKITPAQNIVS